MITDCMGLPSVLAFTVVCIITSHCTTVGGSDATLIITNDGPAILGATATFMAKLSFPNKKLGQPETQTKNKPKSSQPVYMYEYTWKQWICGKWNEVTVKQNLTCNFTRTYKCPEDLGEHTVWLEVRTNTFLYKEFVVENTTKLMITEHINANLSITQGMSCKVLNGLTTCSVVATNKSVDMSVNIHDPSDFFKDATIMYYWVFGDGTESTVLDQPKVNHNYTKPGRYNITVDLTAFFPNNERLADQKSRNGSLQHHLRTMDVIKNLTIVGKSQIDAGSKEQYNISCNASPPMYFCWYITPTTTHTSYIRSQPDKENCNKTILTNTTWLIVEHYFRKNGGYNVGVYANNAVSSSNSNKNVYATGQPNRTTAGLVIGILFGIAMFIVCIVVFTTYVRRRKKQQVEVANFDFQGQRSRSTLGASVRQFIWGGNREENIALSQDFIRSSKI